MSVFFMTMKEFLAVESKIRRIATFEENEKFTKLAYKKIYDKEEKIKS